MRGIFVPCSCLLLCDRPIKPWAICLVLQRLIVNFQVVIFTIQEINRPLERIVLKRTSQMYKFMLPYKTDGVFYEKDIDYACFAISTCPTLFKR
jgi:hypothetical protein